MENKIDIYKIIYSIENNALIEDVDKCFKAGKTLSKKMLNKIKVANGLSTKGKLIDCCNKSELNQENLTGYDLIYIAVIEDKIVCQFCHSYYKNFNQIYLDQADTYKELANKGLGTEAYKKIVKDINKTFSPSTICADAISVSGQRFLEKVGFLPNTHPDSKNTNAILYCNNKQPFLIELSDLPTNRNMDLAPNVAYYNALIRYAKVQGFFNSDDSRDLFYKIYNIRQNGYKISDILTYSRPIDWHPELMCIDLSYIPPNITPPNIKKK